MTAQQIGSQGANVRAVLAEPYAGIERRGFFLVLAGLGAKPALAGAGNQDLDGILRFLIGFSDGHVASWIEAKARPGKGRERGTLPGTPAKSPGVGGRRSK